MGVDYKSVCFVGRWVDNPGEYLIEKDILTEEEVEYIDGECDWRDHDVDLELDVHPSCSYSSRPEWAVGFQVYGEDPEEIGNDILKYSRRFFEITGEYAQFIHWVYAW